MLTFNQWSSDNKEYFESASKLQIAEAAFNAAQKTTLGETQTAIETPTVELMKDIYDNVLKFVNAHLGWELPESACGAIHVWYDGDDFMVDVETSDGGVSAIHYSKFRDLVRNGKMKDDNYKVSHEEFNECF